MKLRHLLFASALLFSSGAFAQEYTFECVTNGSLSGDSCDVCPTTIIERKSFNGLVIYKDSTFYKWIGQPYDIRAKPGGILEYYELIPNGERVTIPMANTYFFTVKGMMDSTFCTGIAPAYRSPALYATGSDPDYYIALSPDNSAVVLKQGSGIDLSRVADTITVAATGGGSGIDTVTITQPAAGISISGNPGLAPTANFVVSLANDLSALEGLTGTGIAARTGIDVWALRTITASTGISVSNGDGSSGNPTITNILPDLTVVLTNGTGISVTGTYPNFTISATNNGTVTSVALSMPSIFSVSGSPVTTSGTLTATLATQSANLVFAGPTTGGAATPTFRSLVTADLASQIVTYAKIQNVSAASRLLGRGSAGGAGSPEEISLGSGLAMSGTTLSVSGVPTGTGTANRFTLWTGTNTIGDDAAFTFDGTNDRMTITGTVAGTGANNAWLNLNGGSITGTAEALRASANLSTSLDVVIANARNISNTGAVKLELQVGGTSAADPYMLFSIPSGSNTAVGNDNSDADKFKITPGGTAPGSSANKGIVVTQDATPLVGVNLDAPTYPLDVTGRTRASTGFMGKFAQWNSGLISFGSGAGTAPTLNSIGGTDNGLYISFTTGTAPVNNGTIFTATYPNSWGAGSIATFSSRVANSSTNIALFRTTSPTSTTFQFVAVGTLPASTNFQFDFSIFGM